MGDQLAEERPSRIWKGKISASSIVRIFDYLKKEAKSNVWKK